jgi:hypothetical protein
MLMPVSVCEESDCTDLHYYWKANIPLLYRVANYDLLLEDTRERYLEYFFFFRESAQWDIVCSFANLLLESFFVARDPTNYSTSHLLR